MMSFPDNVLLYSYAMHSFCTTSLTLARRVDLSISCSKCGSLWIAMAERCDRVPLFRLKSHFLTRSVCHPAVLCPVGYSERDCESAFSIHCMLGLYIYLYTFIYIKTSVDYEGVMWELLCILFRMSSTVWCSCNHEKMKQLQLFKG